MKLLNLKLELIEKKRTKLKLNSVKVNNTYSKIIKEIKDRRIFLIMIYFLEVTFQTILICHNKWIIKVNSTTILKKLPKKCIKQVKFSTPKIMVTWQQSTIYFSWIEILMKSPQQQDSHFLNTKNKNLKILVQYLLKIIRSRNSIKQNFNCMIIYLDNNQ